MGLGKQRHQRKFSIPLSTQTIESSSCRRSERRERTHTPTSSTAHIASMSSPRCSIPFALKKECSLMIIKLLLQAESCLFVLQVPSLFLLTSTVMMLKSRLWLPLKITKVILISYIPRCVEVILLELMVLLDALRLENFLSAPLKLTFYPIVCTCCQPLMRLRRMV